MKITKTQLKRIIKEELETTMEEGMFGDMKDKAYSMLMGVIKAPGIIAVGIALGFLIHKRPRDGFTAEILQSNPDMMQAIVDNFGPGGAVHADGGGFLSDWQDPAKTDDEIKAKYFTLNVGSSPGLA